MTVIYSAGYVLPGGDLSLKNARICHSLNWLSGGSVDVWDGSDLLMETGEHLLLEDATLILLESVNATATDYFPAAPLNTMTGERWKPTAVPATWEYNHGSAQTVDYAALAGHTLTGCTIRFEYWSGAAWVALTPDTAITDNGPLLALFPPVSAAQWRLYIVSGPVPEIAVIKFGRALQMEVPFYGGHTPIDLGRKTILKSTFSESGEYLGRSRLRVMLGTSFAWQHLTAAWVRANWPTLQKAVETEPFWIAWRPSQYGEVGYCQTDAVPVPENMGIRDLMSVEMTVRGLAYD